MANVYAGGNFVFTTAFLMPSGQPIVPVDPVTIMCFYFDASGSKITFVPSGTTMSAIAGYAGRYSYSVTVPSDIAVNTEVYGIMTCTDPNTGADVVVEQTVTVIPYTSSVDGLRVSFVKPSGFP